MLHNNTGDLIKITLAQLQRKNFYFLDFVSVMKGNNSCLKLEINTIFTKFIYSILKIAAIQLRLYTLQCLLVVWKMYKITLIITKDRKEDNDQSPIPP